MRGKRLKVGFINTLYAPNEIGGAELAVRIAAEALVEHGHEAVVISLAPNGHYSVGDLRGVKVYYVPLANIYWKQGSQKRPVWARALWHLIDAYNPVMSSRIRRILKAELPDVVETNNLQGFSVAVWQAAAGLKIPVVQVLHDYYLSCVNSTMYRRGRNCGRQCRSCHIYCGPRRWLSNIPAVVAGVSHRTLTRILAARMFARVQFKSVVPSAIVVAGRPPNRKNKHPGSPLIIGYLGRIDRIKGVEILLRAVANIATTEVTLLLGGRGANDYVEQLKQTFASPNIHFLGFVRPDEFFAKIDMLVVPSLWEEPLGRVIYEGYSHGVPSIVSRVGGMPEIVSEGLTGYIVNVNDHVSLTKLISAIVRQGLPAEQFVHACYRRSAEFTIESVFAKQLANWQRAVTAYQNSGA